MESCGVTVLLVYFTFSAVRIVNAQNSTLPGSEYVVPDSWKQFCSIRDTAIYQSDFTRENVTFVQCQVREAFSGVWSMAELRDSLEQSTAKVSFDITCYGQANISLSWPIKVKNLYVLKVRDCVVLDFLADYKDELVETIPDSLRELELNSNRITISVKTFVEMLQNVRNVSKEFDCGHETTLERLTVRNISYDFLESYEEMLMSLTALGEQFILDTRRVSHKCDFHHLLYLDEGDSDSLSTYHFSLLTDTAIYDQLRVYNISYNHMAVLTDQVLQWSVNFPRLEYLDISHNDVSSLYRFAIPVHTRLHPITTIDLRYNNISMVTVKDLLLFEKMPMVQIDLRNNPIACNCTEPVKELLHFIQQERYSQQHNLSSYSYLADMTCATPASLAGRTLGSLAPGDLPCDTATEYFLVPVICLSISVVFLCLVLLVLVRYRKEVRILMFTRFHVILPCQMEEADGSKTFDAFVSYSSQDEEWVESVFEKLEQSAPQTLTGKPFKFCLHHRDFVPGRTIFNNVISSVESSRHTIILLSSNFIKSEFCLYEFHEAFQQSILEKKRHLLIVMMEDLREEELPKDLRRCIKTFTYIRKDDFLFFDRLVYALSVKEKSRADKKVKHGSSDVRNSDVSPTTGNVNGQSNGISTIDKTRGQHNCQLTGIELVKTVRNSVVDYDRSLSTCSGDTGYGSDRNSYTEKPLSDTSFTQPKHPQNHGNHSNDRTVLEEDNAMAPIEILAT